MRECQAVFGASRVVVFSNSAGSADDRGFAQAARLTQRLGVTVLQHGTKKPAGADVLARHLAAGSASPGLSAYAMVGDRALTDAVFGHAHGMLVIQTRALTLAGDSRAARLVRPLEAAIARRMLARGARPPAHPVADALGDAMPRR